MPGPVSDIYRGPPDGREPDWLKDDAENRCPICDWPMADSRENGCVTGDCSYRPADPAEQRRIEKRRAALSPSCETCRGNKFVGPSGEPWAFGDLGGTPCPNCQSSPNCEEKKDG